MKKIIAVMICAVLFLTACSAAPSETNSSAATAVPETGYESAESIDSPKDESAAAVEEAGGLVYHDFIDYAGTQAEQGIGGAV